MPNEIDLTHLYHRNKLLWGVDAQEQLWQKHVMVVGLGGVGGNAAEALARAGVGSITLVDFDTVDTTNINRQLVATLETVNQPKVEVLASRLRSINLEITLNLHNVFYNAEYNETLFSKQVDYVIDAIDSVNAKLDLIEYCIKNNINIISSLGTGNRLDPTQLYFTTIEETAGNLCPFAKKVRLSLKKREINKGLKILTSRETPIKPDHSIMEGSTEGKKPPGSSPFVPPAAGLALASFVVRELVL